jgi:hypothetical protein
MKLKRANRGVDCRPHAQDLTENHRCEASRSIGTERGRERLREGLRESGGKATGGEG